MSRRAGSSGLRRVIEPRRILRSALVLAAAVAVTLGGILWYQANTTLHVSDLRSDPAFSLRMPDADELAEVGSEGQVGIDGSTSAFAGHIFGTQATSAGVYAFYDRELARLGWRVDTPPYAMSTAELENKLYCKSKESLRLAIKDKSRAFETSFYKGRSYVTVFDASLVAVNPTQPCPKPPLPPAPTPIR